MHTIRRRAAARSLPSTRRMIALALLFLEAALISRAAQGGEVRLRNGFAMEGNTFPFKAIADGFKDGINGAAPGDPITVIEDVLRRVYVPRLTIEEFKPGREEPLEKFDIRQIGRATVGAPVATVGPAIKISDWDAFGKRTYTMSTDKGALPVIQCITAITPKYVTVEAYKDLQWTSYIATTSIKPETLYAIIMRNIDQKRLANRLRVVRFYMQMESFDVAEKELTRLLDDFPERREDNERTLRDLRQLVARRVIEEIKVRRAAGQHRLVYTLLKNFPSKGVAGEILAEVDEFLNNKDGARPAGYEVLLTQRVELLKLVESDMKELSARDTKHSAALDVILKEILAEYSVHTLDRLVPYRELRSDPSLALEQKVALAISGWTQGPKGATNNLPIALSMYRVRDLVRTYMNAEIKLDRDEILAKMRKEEGASPERLAALVAHMKPPKNVEEKADGYYQLSVEGLTGGPAMNYLVQLPPEYNPYRRYPAIVTLNGGSTTPAMQIDWWAGGVDAKGNRQGQGSRNGYIVIAPMWAAAHRAGYGYSLEEHAAVLYSLRDACRRFSVDTDRVYLSGHAMGGTAAWDIGLAHPDLFAGVIPIACQIGKYIDLYWENARQMPLYYVVGQMDGGRLAVCAMSLDRYMRGAFPTIVTEYIGRGHEDFSDEQLRLFDWMSRQRRDFARKEFDCVTMRPWDSFFWWTEMEDMPAVSMVLPEEWDRKPRRTLFHAKGKVINDSTLIISGGATKVTLYLSPELVDFSKPLKLTVTGAAKTYPPAAIKPSVDVILEDVRTRGDRQHPFWAKLVVKDGAREAAAPARRAR